MTISIVPVSLFDVAYDRICVAARKAKQLLETETNASLREMHEDVIATKERLHEQHDFFNLTVEDGMISIDSEALKALIGTAHAVDSNLYHDVDIDFYDVYDELKQFL